MNSDASATHRQNANAWDETAGWYAHRVDEIRGLLSAGGSTLHAQELKLLGMLPPLDTWCDHAVHLQCAAGFDSISLANLGAREVTGVDIAGELTGIGNSLARELGVPVKFKCADVLEVTGLDGQADLVYTGKGAVHWMFDLPAWAAKVAKILRPGGWFLLFDFHPMMWLFRDGTEGLELNQVSYFAPVITYQDWAPGHFSGPCAPLTAGSSPKRLRPWPPSAVIQSLIGAGLELAIFHEYPDSLTEGWTAYPRATTGDRSRIASTYAVMARKP